MRSLTIGHFIRRYRYFNIRKLSSVVWILEMLEMKQFPKIIGQHFVIITLRQWYNRGRLQQPCSCTKQFPLIIAVLINEVEKNSRRALFMRNNAWFSSALKSAQSRTYLLDLHLRAALLLSHLVRMVLLLNQDALGRIALVFVIKGACLTGMDDGVVFWSVGKVRGHEILAKRSKVNGLQFPVRNALFKDGGFGASRLHSTAQWLDNDLRLVKQ